MLIVALLFFFGLTPGSHLWRNTSPPNSHFAHSLCSGRKRPMVRLGLLTRTHRENCVDTGVKPSHTCTHSPPHTHTDTHAHSTQADSLFPSVFCWACQWWWSHHIAGLSLNSQPVSQLGRQTGSQSIWPSFIHPDIQPGIQPDNQKLKEAEQSSELFLHLGR